jgi:hypothetical protein
MKFSLIGSPVHSELRVVGGKGFAKHRSTLPNHHPLHGPNGLQSPNQHAGRINGIAAREFRLERLVGKGCCYGRR